RQDLLGAASPGDVRHRHKSVPQRGAAEIVKLVVDPDAAGAGQAGPALAAVAGDGDERGEMARAGHDRGVLLSPLPGDDEGQQTQVAGRRLDDVAATV